MKRIKYYFLIIILMFPLIVLGDSGRYTLCSYRCPYIGIDDEWCTFVGETVTIAFLKADLVENNKILGVVFDGDLNRLLKVDSSVLVPFNNAGGSCPEGQQIEINLSSEYITEYKGDRNVKNTDDTIIYTSPSDYNERERTTNDISVSEYFINDSGEPDYRIKRYQYNTQTKAENTTYSYPSGAVIVPSDKDALICIYTDGRNQLVLAFENDDNGSVAAGRTPLGFVNYYNSKSYMCRTVDSSDPIVSSADIYRCPAQFYCDNNKCYKSGGSGRTAYQNIDGLRETVSGKDISDKICLEPEPEPLEVPDARNICSFMDEFKFFFEEKIIVPLRIGAVIIFLILTTVDYAKVIFDKEASPKKANTRLFKRIIALLIIFFANEIVNFVMLILGQGCPRT